MLSKAEEIEQKQNKLKQKAKQIEQNLLNMRVQKLDTFRKELKADLAQNIQTKYDDFKNKFEHYFLDQLELLKLEREMKKSEMLGLQERIVDAINQLKASRNKLQQMKHDLTDSAQSAAEHLELNMQIQLKQLLNKQQEELRLRVEEYAELVYIQ